MSTKIKSPNELPEKPGIYIMRNKNDNIIYIGKSKSLKNRVKSYFKDKHDSPKTHVLMNQFNSLEYIITNSEKEALILEANLIKKHMPRYNIRLKDDKRYPYVKITNEKFPRIIITRNIGKEGSYYGPFTDVGSVRRSVKFLKSLFKIRTCKNMDGPCLNSQIDLCYGPCDNGISVEAYKKTIEKIDLFFKGKYSQILENLKKEMEESAINQEYEKAAVIRDQINSIKEVMEKQFVDFKDELDQDVIAMSHNKESSIVIVLSIREGKIIGKDDFLMSGTMNQDNGEILSAFIEQYYGITRHIPHEIILEEKIPDESLIKEWLSDLRNSEIKSIESNQKVSNEKTTFKKEQDSKSNTENKTERDNENNKKENETERDNGNNKKENETEGDNGNNKKENETEGDNENNKKENKTEGDNENNKKENETEQNEKDMKLPKLDVKLTVAEDGKELRLVRMASKNAEIIKKQKKKMKNSMIELKKYLKLEKLPRIIEGYDVSNISGKLAVGSKVSFFDSKPNKKEYRHFKLKTPGPDDYAMMRELLSRRFKSLAKNLEKDANYTQPNLILIDGGKGQLKIATEVLKEYNLEHIPVIGLAKEFEEVFIPYYSTPIIIPKNNQGLHLLQRVRDESHRFAVSYHRKLRSKNIESSELDEIPGIGKTRKINLLKHFKNIEAVKKADEEELAKVKGMTKKAAKNVHDYFKA
jgi:excinuclease ABC subunit C